MKIVFNFITDFLVGVTGAIIGLCGCALVMGVLGVLAYIAYAVFMLLKHVTGA